MLDKNNIVVAVDCMGSDSSPEDFVAAVSCLVDYYPNVHFILCGDPDILNRAVTQFNIQDKVLVHATQEPSKIYPDIWTYATDPAIRRTSMGHAIDMAAHDEVQLVVSGGNTALYAALCVTLIKTNTSRAALASFLPSVTGKPSIMLDVGAGIRASGQVLTEFGIMGAELAYHSLGITNPRIGILNIGTEFDKGPDSMREALRNLQTYCGHDNVCFIEGYDLFSGAVDVIITDGLSGNIAIKTAEGLWSHLLNKVRITSNQSWWNWICGYFCRSLLKSALAPFDPAKHNFGLWLGLNSGATMLKIHGKSSVKSIREALKSGIAMRERGDTESAILS